eukprot:jgi/Bigna1/75952/fgenesh1_pg.38_\
MGRRVSGLALLLYCALRTVTVKGQTSALVTAAISEAAKRDRSPRGYQFTVSKNLAAPLIESNSEYFFPDPFVVLTRAYASQIPCDAKIVGARVRPQDTPPYNEGQEGITQYAYVVEAPPGGFPETSSGVPAKLLASGMGAAGEDEFIVLETSLIAAGTVVAVLGGVREAPPGEAKQFLTSLGTMPTSITPFCPNGANIPNQGFLAVQSINLRNDGVESFPFLNDITSRTETHFYGRIDLQFIFPTQSPQTAAPVTTSPSQSPITAAPSLSPVTSSPRPLHFAGNKSSVYFASNAKSSYFRRLSDNNCLPCGLGFYCPNGFARFPCPPKSTTFVLDARSISRCECPPGTFGKKGEECTDCVLGEFCPGNREKANRCPRFNYCPSTQVKIPCNATLGHYCPAGTFAADPRCEPGYFCPNFVTKSPCPPGNVSGEGFYCPSGSTTLALCPSGFRCATPVTIEKCKEGELCPPGTFTDISCPATFYCNGLCARRVPISPSPVLKASTAPLPQLKSLVCQGALAQYN